MKDTKAMAASSQENRKRKASKTTATNASTDEPPQSKKKKVTDGKVENKISNHGETKEADPAANHKHSAEEAAAWKKLKKLYQKEKLQKPKLFLLPSRPPVNGAHNSMPKNNGATKVIMKKRREPVSLTEVMYLLQYALLGSNASFQPSWCKVLRVTKISKVVLIVLNGVTSRTYRRKRHCFPNVASRSVSVKLIPAYSYFAMLQDILSCTKSINKVKVQKRSIVTDAIIDKRAKKQAVNRILNPTHGDGAGADEDPGGDPAPGKTHYLLTSDELQRRGFPTAQTEGCVHTNYADHVTDSSPLFGLDCEMVLTSAGSELARVSVIDDKGKLLYNSFVKPPNPVLNYLTKYSGITKAILTPVQTALGEAQQALIKALPPDGILVGQGLENDMRALKMYHPYCVDTSDMFSATERKIKLKYLAKEYLDRDIQCSTSGHDSIEDAQAAIDLFKLKLALGDKLKNYYAEEVSSGPVFKERESIFQTALEQDKKTSAVDTRFTLKKFKKEPVSCVVCSNDQEIVKKAGSAIRNSDFVYMQLHGYNNLLQGSTVEDTDIETTLSLMDERVGSVLQALPPNTLHVTLMPGTVQRRNAADAQRGGYKTRQGRCVVGLAVERIPTIHQER